MRRRRNHEQLGLFDSRRRRRKDGKLRKKPGPKRRADSGSPHGRRPALKSRYPVHVVLRAASNIQSLRKRELYQAFRLATIAAARREAALDVDERRFRIVHVSIQRTHVHLLVEARDRMALSRGMQGFQISAARHINAAISRRTGVRRRGAVFPDRFHQEIIDNPRQARHALSYVLNNWRKHAEDRHAEAKHWNVDPYSTGLLFSGWAELADRDSFWKWRDTYDPMLVFFPRTWLLRTAWQRHGAISYDDVPRRR